MLSVPTHLPDGSNIRKISLLRDITHIGTHVT